MISFSSRLLACAALLLPFLNPEANASPVLLRRQNLDPNDDPFYQVPDDAGDYDPGYVFNTRPVTTKINAPGSISYQLLFRTTGKDGEASATVATVWEPATKAPGSPKIFAYQFAEDSDNLDCNPSWAWVSGSASNAQAPERNLQGPLVIPWALSQGFYVVSTDAEGPLAAWLVGKIEGQSVLDAIRATISNYGLDDASAALYGYSGGAHTTVWAITLAADYAPELSIVGAAFGGTPIDLGSAFDTVNDTPISLIAGAALFGLANGYSELNDEFNRLLTPEGQQIASDIRSRNNCTSGSSTSLDYNTIFDGGDIMCNDVLRDVLAQENLLEDGVAVPTIPRFQYHGTNDTVSPFQPEQDYVDQQCQQGADLRFIAYEDNTHGEAGVLGLGGALIFVYEALFGTIAPGDCGSDPNLPALGSQDSINILGQSLDSTLKQLASAIP